MNDVRIGARTMEALRGGGVTTMGGGWYHIAYPPGDRSIWIYVE